MNEEGEHFSDSTSDQGIGDNYKSEDLQSEIICKETVEEIFETIFGQAH